MRTTGDQATEVAPQTTEAPTGVDQRPGAMMRALLVMLLLDIAIPIITFQVARDHGASETVAYLLAGIGPLVGIVLQVARTRRLDTVSAIFLGMYLVSAAIAAVPSADPKLLLLKDSAVTAAFGIVCLVTLLPVVPKPLMYYFGRRFGSDGSERSRVEWEQRWATLPGFRRTMQTLTVMWGVGMLLEAALKVAATQLLGFDAAYVATQVIPFVLVGVLITATVTHVKRQRAVGERRRAATAGAPR